MAKSKKPSPYLSDILANSTVESDNFLSSDPSPEFLSLCHDDEVRRNNISSRVDPRSSDYRPKAFVQLDLFHQLNKGV